MSEHDQQAALVKWFNLQYPKLKGCLFAIPNGTHLAGDRAQRGRKMNKLKAEGFKVGVSDLFLCVASNGYHGLFLEMKDKVPPKRRTKRSLRAGRNARIFWEMGFWL